MFKHAMTQGSCSAAKGDSVGAGPRRKLVNLFLMAQYAGQSIMKCISSSAEPAVQNNAMALLPVHLLCQR